MDFLASMLGSSPKPSSALMSPSNPNGLDFNKGASGAFAPTPGNPYQSPAKFQNPNDFDLATKAKGYVAPGGYSGIDPPKLDEGIPWGQVAMAGAQGLASAMGGGAAPEGQLPGAAPVSGGQYYTRPKGNLSGANLGILGQPTNKQL